MSSKTRLRLIAFFMSWGHFETYPFDPSRLVAGGEELRPFCAC
jgi:hypothetical protein